MSDMALSRGSWRSLLVGAVHRSGLMRLVRRVSRSYELRPGPALGWLRWRRVRSPKFVILCYHRVGTEGIPLFSAMPPETFDAQMRYLRETYRVLSLEELYRELQQPATDGQAVAITFDDGYRDTFTHAFPILRKYGLPATVFLTVGSVETGEVPWYDRVFLALKVFPEAQLELGLDRPRRFLLSSQTARLRAAAEIVRYLRGVPDGQRRDFCRDLESRVSLPKDELSDRMLTWDQVREMQRFGVTFGSHTVTHPVVAQLAPADLPQELLQSRLILEQRLGAPVKDFAFPFGQPADCGRAAEQSLPHFGYRMAMTTLAGIVAPGADYFALRRLPTGDEPSLAVFALKLSRVFLDSAEEETESSHMFPRKEWVSQEVRGTRANNA